MREIEGATASFQQRLNGLWEQYRAMYDQVATVTAVGACCLLLSARYYGSPRPQLPMRSPLPVHPPTPPPPCPSARLQEAEGAAAKQRAAAAQSVAGVRHALAAKAAEVAQKIERGSKKAAKMPELAQMLMPFLD
jgi:hypothetical protein